MCLILQYFEVCVASYEIYLIEQFPIKNFSFEFAVLDGAHWIKNIDSMLLQNIRAFYLVVVVVDYAQKNLKVLLDFICPEIFVDYASLNSYCIRLGGRGN